MIRLFDNHRIRRVVELEGIWDFVKEDGKKEIIYNYSDVIKLCVE